MINKHDDAEEIKAEHKKSNMLFSDDDVQNIIELYKSGNSIETICKKYKCSYARIYEIICSQDDAEKIKEENKRNVIKFTKEKISQIINRYRNGESSANIALDFDCSQRTIMVIVAAQENADELKEQHKINSTFFNKEQQEQIFQKYRTGNSLQTISKEFHCSLAYIHKLIKNHPDSDTIKAEHRANSTFFTEQQKYDILTRKINGEAADKIALDYNCSSGTIWKLINKEFNKNRAGTTKETFLNKYEQYTTDELKTRISEFVSLKEVEENDELLEIMYFLDEKAKFGEDEKALSIDFIRLLDKLEQRRISAKNVIESQTVKDLFDLMDKDLIKQQIFEELNKDYNAAIEELNSCDNEALGNICSKYIAHNIDDENNIASMKEILNIISSNKEAVIRHKLVAFDNMKQNPNDERIKEAQEIYGEDNQEKIGQYIIFDQALKGEYSNADFNNDALKFADKLKDIHLNRDAIIKRLIELEDYFNSKEAQNNSLTNFIKNFNSNDNYINKILTDFYIDNIYKDKITTIEVTADSKYFGGKNVTLMIYPEAKQSTLENTEVNIDKHQFLVDSEEYARNFANRKLGSLGVKIFTIDKSYQKEGFYSGDNVLEIKVPNGHNGARLAAKIKNEDDKVFEIRYFMPKGFHKEKKRTDL